jgi:hypothetical protein
MISGIVVQAKFPYIYLPLELYIRGGETNNRFVVKPK